MLFFDFVFFNYLITCKSRKGLYSCWLRDFCAALEKGSANQCCHLESTWTQSIKLDTKILWHLTLGPSIKAYEIATRNHFLMSQWVIKQKVRFLGQTLWLFFCILTDKQDTKYGGPIMASVISCLSAFDQVAVIKIRLNVYRHEYLLALPPYIMHIIQVYKCI